MKLFVNSIIVIFSLAIITMILPGRKKIILDIKDRRKRASKNFIQDTLAIPRTCKTFTRFVEIIEEKIAKNYKTTKENIIISSSYGESVLAWRQRNENNSLKKAIQNNNCFTITIENRKQIPPFFQSKKNNFK